MHEFLKDYKDDGYFPISNYSMKLSIDSVAYENIRNQLHETRLESANSRALITKLNREKLEL